MQAKQAVVFILAFTFCFTFSIATCLAEPPLTAKELIEKSKLKNHVKELEEGGIVLIEQPDSEEADELDVAMAILVPAPLAKTVEILQRQAADKNGPGILAMGEIAGSPASSLEKVLAGVAYAPTEEDEVKKMMTVEPGEEFNFSQAEIAFIQKEAGTVKNGHTDEKAIRAMSQAMREIMKNRYLSYRKSGLAGLAPYQLGATKQVFPSEELIAATEALRLVKKRFPDYYRCLRFYPENSSAGLVHQFYWVKQTESDRPLFFLKHWIVDNEPDYALIAERRFYLNHTLDSLQVIIGCLPHGDGTLAVLLNQTFTEKVDVPIGRSIAKHIGHKQVEKNILPIFENLRAAIRR